MDNEEYAADEGRFISRPGSRVGNKPVLEWVVPPPKPPVIPVPEYPFPLLRLPTELQIKILSYLLPSNKILEVPENLHNDNGATRWNDEKYGTWVDYWNPGDICQLSILLVSKYMYELGKDILYGRTLRIHVWENGIDFLDEQHQVSQMPSYFCYDYFRKLSIQVHPTDFTYHEAGLRENFLGVCGLLANSVDMIEDLEIEFMGETWDSKENFSPSIDLGFRKNWSNLMLRRKWEEVDNKKSEADIVALMLEPIAQIQNVNRFSIHLPASAATDTSLQELAQKYRKVALGYERFKHAEKMRESDYGQYLLLRENFGAEPCNCWSAQVEGVTKWHDKRFSSCFSTSAVEDIIRDNLNRISCC
ncbi:MAG: hypothetical protein Q9167_001461 [Letrouitia subvulpina]